MQYKNIFKMLTEICMKNKRFIECVKTELHYNFSYFSQCIASQLESNFLKSPAYYESTKHYCRLHISAQISGSVTLVMKMAAFLQ